MPEARWVGGLLRRAAPPDLAALWELETACFEPARRASRASLRRSLQSPRQSAWLVEAGGQPVACMVLWHHPRTLRLYDLATHPDHRGRGHAHRLLAHAEGLAAAGGQLRVVLEAAADRDDLVSWYARRGYRVTRTRRDFYAPGHHAVRMEKRVTPTATAP